MFELSLIDCTSRTDCVSVSLQCSRIRWITRQPYGCVESCMTWFLKAEMIKSSLSLGKHSIIFWITWFPFWSFTQRIIFPLSSPTIVSCWSWSRLRNKTNYSKNDVINRKISKMTSGIENFQKWRHKSINDENDVIDRKMSKLTLRFDTQKKTSQNHKKWFSLT